MAEVPASSIPLVVAGVLASQYASTLLLVGGVLVVVLGVLRLLRLIPRLSVNLFGRRDNPQADGIAMILVGVALVIFSFVR